MKKPLSLLLALSIGLAGCQKSDSNEADFAKLADEYINVFLANNPGGAVYLGFHDYDGKLIIPTPDTIARQLARLRQYDSPSPGSTQRNCRLMNRWITSC